MKKQETEVVLGPAHSRSTGWWQTSHS